MRSMPAKEGKGRVRAFRGLAVTIDARIGSVLAGFRIESLLGKGGMSVVYLAEQQFPKRWVALKLLTPELSEDERFRERFVRESNIAASMDHPNVIPIYGAGEVEGQLYIAMRYVKGIDLKRLIQKEGPLDPARAVSIISQVAGALDVAHGDGLVHRDVKPGNILLASGPESVEHVYLSDFGLTKRTSSESGITGTGQFVGTLDYAAPEQFEGKALDARTDVYSLGCVTFECLTGQVPFKREGDAALMYAHLMAPRPKPSELRPELPVGVDDVLEHAMAKRPEDRYLSAGSFAGALREAVGTVGAVSAPPVRRRRTRRRTLVIGGSAAAAIVATALIVFALTSGKAPAPSAAPRAVGNSLVGLDPATGKVTSVIPVGVQPTQLIELPDGSMWAYNGTDQTISIIDPSSDRLVQTFGASSLASTTPLASGFGSVWFVRDDETVTRLNPSTHLVERVIKVPHHLNRLATGEDLVWTANGDGTVSMIDPSANTLLRTINIDTSADAIGVGQGAAWITSYNEGTVTKVDAKTGGVTHVDVGGNPTAVEVGFDGVWVLNQGNATVERIAPATLTVTTIPIGRVRALGRGGIAFSATNVWATDPGTGNVVRIDPLTNKARAFHLGFTPVGIAIQGTTVWVTVTLAV